MPGGIPEWNFNSHTELSDSDWFLAQFYVIHGRAPSQAEYSAGMTYLTNNGRWGTYQASVTSSIPNLDTTSNWFAHVPGYAWLAGALVAGVIAAVIIIKASWKAFGPKASGSSGEY